MDSRIIVATDGGPGALGALRTAQLLAKRDGRSVEVVAVREPPMRFYGLAEPAVSAELIEPIGPEVVDALRDRVHAQLQSLDGGAEWPLSLVVDSVAPAIVRFAARADATLLLLGLRPYRVVERWLGRETLLRVIHLSHLPVMAVPGDASALPRTAVAAIDLSELSLRAARLAAEMVGPEGELHLVHTTWAPLPGENWATMDWVKTYRAAVEERVEELAAELGGGGSPTVHRHVFESGVAGRQILRVAEEVGADLIAAGSHGHGYFGRLILGSTSSRLVHAARCAVLIVPPSEVAAELKGAREETTLPMPFPGMAELP